MDQAALKDWIGRELAPLVAPGAGARKAAGRLAELAAAAGREAAAPPAGSLLPFLAKAAAGADLTGEEGRLAMLALMSGQADEREAALFLVALKLKGERPAELAGLARGMREKAARIAPAPPAELLDTCGTGGDAQQTFNVSTAAMFVLAGAGVKVAKHGNRALTSRCGSADVLEALGVRIDLPPAKVEACLRELGLGFMFAPLFHPAMRFVMPVRKALPCPTVFNYLGPLTNPAGAGRHLLGVRRAPGAPGPADFARIFRELGATRVLAVQGEAGGGRWLDEFSTLGRNEVAELDAGEIREYAVEPAALGLAAPRLEDLAGGDPAANARDLEALLAGGGRPALADLVALNAGAGFVAAGRAATLPAGLELARRSLAGGQAKAKLEELRRWTQRAAAASSS